MKISEVIAELEDIRRKQGDLPVLVRRWDQGRYGWEEASYAATSGEYFQHHDDGGSYQDFAAYLE